MVGWIAAIFGLVGALLAGGLAYLASRAGADIAAKSATDAVAQQLSGETEKSRAEFLRGQRQVLYSRVIQDEETLYQTEARYRVTLADAKPGGKINTFITQFATLVGKLAVDGYSLDIVGSQPVRDRFEDLRERHADYLVALFKYGTALNESKSTDVLLAGIADGQDGVIKAEHDLANAGRADMGIK